MKKIVITCAPLPPPNGGIANWYRIVQEEATKNGVCLININTSSRKSIAGRSIFYRIFIQGFRMLAQYYELRQIIKGNQDAHAAHITTSGHLALVRDILFLHLLMRKGIKTVYHIHFGRVPDIFQKKKLEYRFIHKAISLASDTVAIDPKTYNVLCDSFGKESVHYIPNPVRVLDVEVFEEKKNVLFLGNVLPAKGIEELLQAWEKLTPEHPDWTLTIAGSCEDNYKAYLENQYSLQNVIMTGYIPHDDAMKLVAKSAFLVLPSYTEGFPNVVIEAMMCGKAVIGTDVGAIADILAGGCGIVIQPKNVDELRNSVEKMIDDETLRRIMGNIGKEKAASKYVADNIFFEYVKLWKC